MNLILFYLFIYATTQKYTPIVVSTPESPVLKTFQGSLDLDAMNASRAIGDST
jgi:hypothetical protein